MISKLIYEYFKLNTLSGYNKCEFKANQIISNEALVRDTLSNLSFKNEWYKKLNKKIKYYHFKFSITSIDEFSNLYRVHVTHSRIFCFNNSLRTYHKSKNENFIFIIIKEKNKYLIKEVAYKEDNPKFYNSLLSSDLESIYSSRTFGDLLWTKRLNDIDILYSGYINLNKSLSNNDLFKFKANATNDLDKSIANTTPSSKIIGKATLETQKYTYRLANNSNSTLINCDDLIKYARKYALNYNKNYTQFSNSGGDCTNFVSQALNFAGLPKSNIWKPYTASWIMVIPLRDYLIKNDIAIEYDVLCPRPVGTIIQFFSPIKERFSHTGIITDMLNNGELLYCCHDYDKLDFPLSETYPIFYKRIRNLQIK